MSSPATATDQPAAAAAEATPAPEQETLPTNVFLGLFIDPEGNVLRHSYVLADDKADALARMGTWPGYTTEAVSIGTTEEPPLPLDAAPSGPRESMAERRAGRAADAKAKAAEAEAKQAAAAAEKEARVQSQPARASRS